MLQDHTDEFKSEEDIKEFIMENTAMESPTYML
jgi:hypothetical protein